MHVLKLIFPVLLSFLLVGCESDEINSSTVALSQQDGIYRGSSQFFYGRFCGPDWPKIREASKEKTIEDLTEIQAVDRLDQICKVHDICYTENHYFNSDCDQAFIQSVNATAFSNKCRVFALSLSHIIFQKPGYKFYAARPDEITLTGYSKMTFSFNPILPLSMGVDKLEAGIHGFSKPVAGEC